MGTSDNVLSGAPCPPATHGTHGETRSVLMCDFQAAPGNHGNVTPETKGEQVRQAAHSSLDDSRPQTAPCRVPCLGELLRPAGVRPASVSGDKAESAGTMAPKRNVGCADFLSPWFPSSLPSCPSSPAALELSVVLSLLRTCPLKQGWHLGLHWVEPPHPRCRAPGEYGPRGHARAWPSRKPSAVRHPGSRKLGRFHCPNSQFSEAPRREAVSRGHRWRQVTRENGVDVQAEFPHFVKDGS